MKRIVLVLFLSCTSIAQPCLADWDAKAEAERQAKKEEAARKEQERKAQADALKNSALAKAQGEIQAQKRKTLGAAANGKSDAEVDRMYDAHIAATTANAQHAAAKAQQTMSSGGAAALKQVTGKSMSELQSLSDEELEALSNQLEAQYSDE